MKFKILKKKGKYKKRFYLDVDVILGMILAVFMLIIAIVQIILWR